MPRLTALGLTLTLGLAVACASGMAQEAGITAKLHPWGQFEPGAWKLVRVATETLDEQGHVVSTSSTDTKTTLLDIDDEGVTLEIQACVEVAGKRFEAEPQTLKQGFHGETACPSPKLKPPVDGQVVVDDRKIACKVQQLECTGPNGKTVTTIYYSPTTAPYVFKRESVTNDPEGKSVVSETSVEVTTLEMPCKVLNEVRNGFYVKTTNKNVKGTVITLAITSPTVPGGVVSLSSKEVDKNGRIVRRSTLELIDFNSDPEKDRTGIFGRKRANRHRVKTTARYGP